MAIGLILARKHSKRLPNKNALRLGEKRLLEWAIDSAIASNVLSEIYVSTDSDKYADMALRAGAKIVKRPQNLAMDTSTSEDGVRHALTGLQQFGALPKVTALLQATTPLTTPETIRRAVNAVEANVFDSSVSVAKAKQKPWWAFKMRKDGTLEPFMVLPPNSPYGVESPPDLWYPSGGVYVFRTADFLGTNRFLSGRCLGVPVGWVEAIDIDEYSDLAFAKYALKLLRRGIEDKRVHKC